MELSDITKTGNSGAGENREIGSLGKIKLCPLSGGVNWNMLKKTPEWNLLPEYQEAFCCHLEINCSKPAQCTASGKQGKHV